MPPTSPCRQPDEAGDTLTTATSLSLGTTTSAYICPAGDLDYWKFAATQGQVISASLAAPMPADYDLNLFTPSGNLLASSRETGADKAESLYEEATVTGDGRGTGEGTVHLVVAPAGSTEPRMGVVRVGGQAFRVWQDATRPRVRRHLGGGS